MAANPRIGLNLLYLRPGLVGGTETYARGLISGLQAVRPEFDFFLFLNRSAWNTFPDSPQFQRVCCPTPLEPSWRHIWEQLRLPGLCRRYRLDVLHSLGYVSPLRLPCAAAVTVHDLLYKRASGMISLHKRIFWGAMIPLSVRRADAVITVSLQSRNDLLELLRVDAETVFVTEEGPGQPLPVPSPWDRVKRKYDLPDHFFLSVGTAEHKRVDLTAAALRILRRDGAPAALVVTGTGAGNGDMLELIAGDGEVRVLGHVPAGELATLYARAVALVCSSELEGFGLPVLEAMSAGTPVIASRGGALPEVIGTGGVLVSGNDAEELAGALHRIVNDGELRARLRAQGLSRVEQFSWQNCAQATLTAYQAALRRHGRAQPK